LVADFVLDVENERWAFAGLFGDGASRTRTGDPLGAIWMKAFAIGFHASPFASPMPFLRLSFRHWLPSLFTAI
jgi:hypothetical protein